MYSYSGAAYANGSAVVPVTGGASLDERHTDLGRDNTACPMGQQVTCQQQGYSFLQTCAQVGQMLPGLGGRGGVFCLSSFAII
jgi:hypothetical protein